MVWVKAEISDETNEYIERLQAQNNCSKPEAVAIALRDSKRQRTVG